ncbi:MAG: hypothetical protein RRY16_02325, partial [Bacilli bacterium]
GIKIGDIMNKRYPRDANNVKTGNGHWGILFEINMEDCYIVVADHFTSGIGPKLRKYVCGQTTIYNRIFNAKDYYQDASWEANRGS